MKFTMSILCMCKSGTLPRSLGAGHVAAQPPIPPIPGIAGMAGMPPPAPIAQQPPPGNSPGAQPARAAGIEAACSAGATAIGGMAAHMPRQAATEAKSAEG